VFGYVAPAAPGGGLLEIRHAGNISPDNSLRGNPVVVRLDHLHIAAYPGGGTHHVLFDFAAQHETERGSERLHFAMTSEVGEGEEAAILGLPIFVGLQVGSEGLDFQCRTVNVRNSGDRTLLRFLATDAFKAGLGLVATWQPALVPLSAMAVGIFDAIGDPKRSSNVVVQDFHLGLDFSASPTGARLAEGSYFAVQVPSERKAVWDWAEWAFDMGRGQVVNRGQRSRLLPYNYVAFSVCRPMALAR
jgi:hypothetical protein